MRWFFILALLPLVACSKPPVFSPAQEKQIVERCLETSGAPGTYSISPGRVTSSNGDNNIPSAWPVETLGGTRAGANAINACIRAQAQAAGAAV